MYQLWEATGRHSRNLRRPLAGNPSRPSESLTRSANDRGAEVRKETEEGDVFFNADRKQEDEEVDLTSILGLALTPILVPVRDL